MAGAFSRPRLLAAFIVWVLAVGLGMTRLLEYETTPSRPSAVPAIWPSASSLVRRPGYPTLVLLAHPQCPCTRATLGELEVLAAQTQGLLDIYVVFLHSDAFDYRSDLWRRAVALPGADVIVDPGGSEIGRFGALASGHVVLYDTQGKLVFSGGITSSRGHAGANRGRDSILALVRHGRADVSKTPVFGCALHNPGAEPRR